MFFCYKYLIHFFDLLTYLALKEGKWNRSSEKYSKINKYVLCISSSNFVNWYNVIITQDNFQGLC